MLCNGACLGCLAFGDNMLCAAHESLSRPRDISCILWNTQCCATACAQGKYHVLHCTAGMVLLMIKLDKGNDDAGQGT